jgi:hypothetical protein
MTTARKLAANRKNARASTGPKSAAGKARASRNARRHGLAIPVWSVPALAAEAEDLARQIACDDPSPTLLELARRIAEAQIDVVRARKMRHDLITPGFSHLPWDPSNPESPSGLGPLESLLTDRGPVLAAIDLYERRALSRRKFAVRNFDLAGPREMQALDSTPTLGPGRSQERLRSF